MAYCIGTYPKWIARLLAWYMSKQKGFNVLIRFRGRGKRYQKGSPKYQVFSNDLRLSDAKTVAVYLYERSRNADNSKVE